MSIMFHTCTWYPLFMFTTFLIDIIKPGKLKLLQHKRQVIVFRDHLKLVLYQ